MFSQYVQQALGMHENTDAVLICDRKGYIEYAKWKDDAFFYPREVVGKHILDVYPELDRRNSTIMQVLKTGHPSFEVEQKIRTWKNETVHCLSTTLPIEVNGVVIGALCASVHYSEKARTGAGRRGKYYCLEDIITQDAQMEELKERVRHVARNHSTVLIMGETGTGKELVAQSLHTCSDRSGGPFISQNCAAIPANLLEGIFFGTEKGSYTGAETRKGLFELADGGTLFLDEINSMDIAMQAKLLKVLEEKKARRLGGYREISFNVRIVCAMNEDPAEVLRAGRLREDLYYRIGVVKLRIPPLRERREDIMLLTDHFIEMYNREMGMHIHGVSELAKNALLTYEWRGNIRELKNTIESAFNTAQNGIITMKDIPELVHVCTKNDMFKVPKPSAGQGGGSLKEMMDEYEKQIIAETLKRSKTMAEAAQKLKISRQNLRYKMKCHQL